MLHSGTHACIFSDVIEHGRTGVILAGNLRESLFVDNSEGKTLDSDA